MQQAVKMVASLLVGLALGAGMMAWKHARDAEQERHPPPPPEGALARLQKLGAKIEVDEQLPARPVIKLDLSGTSAKITDGDLPVLRGLTELQDLCLDGSAISNDGLKQLRGLSKLETLSLRDTNISDAGLAHLQGMTSLQSLGLSRTKVGDAGLAHVKGLTNLKTLQLFGSPVTEAGVQDLQQALPEVKVMR